MERVFSELSENPIRRSLWYWSPVIIYAAIIFYLSSLLHPEEQLPKLLPEILGDKALHLIEYAVLAVLTYRAFRWAAGPAAARQAVILTIAAASFYGMTDEIHQAFVPFRESSWLDWVADTIGGAIGAMSAKGVLDRVSPPSVS